MFEDEPPDLRALSDDELSDAWRAAMGKLRMYEILAAVEDDESQFQQVRLLGAAGAMFALLPVPDPSWEDVDAVLMDVELLSPERLVRCLGRRVNRTFLESLASAWMQAAQEPHPELSVATVEDFSAGLAFRFVHSTDFDVTVEVLITPDLETRDDEPDGLSFDVTRSALIGAAHHLEEQLS